MMMIDHGKTTVRANAALITRVAGTRAAPRLRSYGLEPGSLSQPKGANRFLGTRANALPPCPALYTAA